MGIRGFESILPGGIPPRAEILLLAPSGSEPALLGAHWLLEGLAHGERVMAILSGESPEAFFARLGRMGIDAPASIASGALVVVDWFTVWTQAVEGIEEVQLTLRASRKPEDLLAAIDRALEVLLPAAERRAFVDVLPVATKALDAFYRGVTNSPEALGVLPQGLNQRSLQYIDFLAPGIVAMSIMQNGVFGLSLFVVSAREKRILKRLQATPAGAGYILAGRIVPAVLISFVQTGVLLSIAVFGFGVKITGNFGVLLLSVAFGALVFICLGFLVSSVSKTVDSAESLTNLITLPMFFLGGVFIPIDRLPAAIQAVAHAMPLTYFSDALRNIMLHGAGLAEVWFDIAILTAFAVVIFAAAVKLFRWE